MRHVDTKTVTALIAELQAAESSELGPKAPVYALLNDELYAVTVQVNHKGNLGPGSVLFLLTKVPV